MIECAFWPWLNRELLLLMATFVGVSIEHKSCVILFAIATLSSAAVTSSPPLRVHLCVDMLVGARGIYAHNPVGPVYTSAAGACPLLSPDERQVSSSRVTVGIGDYFPQFSSSTKKCGIAVYNWFVYGTTIST